MKNKIFSSLILLIFIIAGFFIFNFSMNLALAQDQSQLISKAPMPTARLAPVSGLINGKVYVVGGSDQYGTLYSKVEAYDINSDSWEIKPEISDSRGGMASGVVGGKLYIMGGSPDPFGTSKTEEYDPQTEQWSSKSPMPYRGWGLAADAINNKIYAIGGFNLVEQGMPYNREYNPLTDQWTLRSPMPTKRSWFGAEAIDNKLYAVGGWNWDDTVELPTLEVYDPISDTWASKADMPMGLTNMSTSVLGGKLYVFGGYGGGRENPLWYATVFVYNPLTDVWTRLPDLPLAMQGAATETINGNIYLFGGATKNGVLNTTYVWQIKRQPDPVIIVPGIMGSWQVRGEWRLDPIFHTYDNLIEALIAAGYKEDTILQNQPTLFTFPYDWRVDNNTTADLLKDKINQVKQITGRDEVDIVAHSMGGIVARSYIQSQNYQYDVDQVIFLGTPHQGSLESYLKYEGVEFISQWGWLQKFYFQIEALEHDYIDLIDYIRVETPAVEQLLPIYDYLKDKQPDNSWQLRTYPLNYPQNNYLENLNNQENISLLKERVNITNIVADLGQTSTLNYLRVVADPDLSDNKWQNGYPENLDKNLDSLEMGNGDDTVPLVSANSLNSVETIETNNSDHTNLPTVMQKEIINALTGTWPDNYYNNKIISTIKRWFFFRVYSPVDFIIIAPDGKKIGKDFIYKREINEIEDAFYSGFDTDSEFVLIPNPENGVYKIELQGTGNGGEYAFASSYIDDDKIKDKQELEIKSEILPGTIDNFIINLNRENPAETNIQPQVDFGKLIELTNVLYDSGEIKKENVKKLLIAQFMLLSKQYDKIINSGKLKQKQLLKLALKLELKLMNKSLELYLNKKWITHRAKDVLSVNINFLIEKINNI